VIAFAHVVQRGEFIAGDLEEAQRRCDARERIIIDHGAAPPAHRFEHDKHEEAAPLVIGRSRSQVSGELGDCSA
jgi:hypothetical protein